MRLPLLYFASALFCSSILRAGPIIVVYSNFDAGYGYNSGSLNIGAGVAVPFTVGPTNDPGFAFALQDIQFAASTSNPSDPVSLALFGDSGGFPSSAIESFNVTLGSDPSVVTVDSVDDPILVSGDQYWIVLSSVNPGEAGWNQSNTQSGVDELGDTWQNFSYSQGAVEVDATLVADTPEPGTFLTLGAGLATILILTRRRIRN